MSDRVFFILFLGNLFVADRVLFIMYSVLSAFYVLYDVFIFQV